MLRSMIIRRTCASETNLAVALGTPLDSTTVKWLGLTGDPDNHIFKIVLYKDVANPTYTFSMNCDETLTGTGADYRGCQTMTDSGKLCQKWTN